MRTIINNKGYGIYLNSIIKEELETLKEILTVKPIVLADYDFGQIEPFSIYRLSDTRIYIPKYYGIKKYGLPSQIKEKEGQDIDFIFKGQLKDHQVDFCNVILKEIKENGSCIGCSSTGSGKTAMALWTVSQIKKRTLIVVHKEFLMNQWIERIQQFLPDASIGIIQQNKCETDKDIIIGMVQTITSREFPPETFDNIGYFVADEVHHLAAKSFSQVLYKCKTKYTLGLSATPKRVDGLTKVLEWFCGPIIKNEIVSEVESPDIKIIEAEYSTNIVPKFNFKGNLNAPNMINQLVIDPIRNKKIINEIIALNKEGRKILVLSGRREHCVQLNEMIGVYNLSTGLYMGGMSNENLEKSNKTNIIFATYQSVSEGYDNPALDTLIMATGMGNVQQSIGRILRRKNKFKPLVVDIIDPEFFGGQARRRKQYYKKNKYIILGEKIKPKVVKDLEDSEDSEEECMFK